MIVMNNKMLVKLNKQTINYPRLNKKLNFRMWFKNGLKAQKLLAQGIALGIMAISKAPCKGKSFVYCPVF